MNLKQCLVSYYKQKFVYPQILGRNTNLRDTFQGKRCFIVGNGLSLNGMDLKKLCNEYTFAVNRFFLHPDFDTIAPRFYVHIEPIRNILTYPKDHAFYWENYYANIERHFKDKETRLFMNVESKEHIERKKIFLKHELYYLAGHDSILNSKNPESDISKPNSFMDGVIYSAICVAVYMGFKEIYLIGCDFDHIIQKREAHFHGDKEKTILDGASNKDLAYNLYLYLSKMERIKSFFEPQGVHIYNAGIGGMTDTFERKNYDDLFLSSTIP